MRRSGILMHISSLDSKNSIGDFGDNAYKFLENLNKANQTLWQILPIGPTSYQDSPYQSFSAYAINHYFISLDMLVSDNLLKVIDLKDIKNDCDVNYEYLFKTRLNILYKAYKNFKETSEYIKFINLESYWLEDYSLFMALKKHFNYKSFNKWDLDIKYRKENSLKKYKVLLKDDINFHKFLQFIAFNQFNKLKTFANKLGIDIIGDLPIYASYDSACVWSNKDYYLLNDNLELDFVAGVPKDEFSSGDQIWGNPLYNWKNIKDDNYNLWVNKIKHSLKLFNYLRLDHFIGFVKYYQMMLDNNKNVISGVYKFGPGEELFKVLNKELGSNLNIILEDLGILSSDVEDLINKLNYPKMRVLQFAFDGNINNPHLPKNHVFNQVLYTGTHDNNTTKGFIDKLKDEELTYLKTFLKENDTNKLTDKLIEVAFKSVSKFVIIPMQDVLNLDETSRMNTPSIETNNWKWRYNSCDFTLERINFLNELSNKYNRNINNKKR